MDEESETQFPMRVVSHAHLEIMEKEIGNTNIVMLEKTWGATFRGLQELPIHDYPCRAVLPLTGQTLKVQNDGKGKYFFQPVVNEPRRSLVGYVARPNRAKKELDKKGAIDYLKSLRLCQLLDRKRTPLNSSHVLISYADL